MNCKLALSFLFCCNVEKNKNHVTHTGSCGQERFSAKKEFSIFQGQVVIKDF